MDEIKNEMPERGAVMLNLIKKRHICGAAAANSTKVRHGMIGDRLKKAIYIEEALRITRNNLKNNGFYYCKPSSGDASTLGNALLVAQVILLLETDATNVALHVIILIICATIKINRPQTKIPTSRKSHMLIEKRAAPSDPRCDCGSYTSRSKQL